MMELRILAHESGAAQAITAATIGPEGCTFGRGQENSLVLFDRDRLVSRNQARIDARDGIYHLSNISSANMMLINDSELGPGESIALAVGDEIRVGRFVLGIFPGDTGMASAPTPALATPAAPPSSTTPELDPLAAFGLDSGTSGDAFADILGPAAQPIPSHSAPPAPAVAPARPVPNPNDRLPPRQQSASGVPDDIFADILGPAAPSVPVTPPSGRATATQTTSATAPTWAAMPEAAPAAGTGVDLFAGLDAPGTGTPIQTKEILPAFDEIGWASATHPTNTNTSTAPRDIIPDDFNPFELPSLATRNTDDPLASLGTARIAGLEDLLGSEGAAPENLLDDLPKLAREPLPDPRVASTMADPLASDLARDDPLALFNEASPFSMLDARSEDIANMRDNTSEIASSFQLPRTAVESAPPATAMPAQPRPAPPPTPPQAEPPRAAPAQAPGVRLPTPGAKPPASAARPGVDVETAIAEAGERLMTAFYAGAGMPEQPAQAPTPEFMHLLGELLAITAQGTVDLMQARAATKHELRAQVTMIAPQANNPLKFAPDGQAAMAQLVGKRFAGFMPPVEAMRDAFNDLRAHQVGMTAGTRAALREVLERFAPEQLEQRITRQSLLDAVLPAARKSRLWDLYTDMYQQIKNEAEDEFHSLFGEAFLKTYDEEVERLSKRGKE
jgi:FHA domain-containing protein